jgi:primosomal protein N' (replication factor Y)
VPFGRRQDIGVLLEVRDSTPVPDHRLCPVLAVLDREPVLPPDLLALARFAATYYHHPAGEVYATLLPLLLRQGRPAVATIVTCWQLTAAGRTALAEDRGYPQPVEIHVLDRELVMLSNFHH